MLSVGGMRASASPGSHTDTTTSVRSANSSAAARTAACDSGDPSKATITGGAALMARGNHLPAAAASPDRGEAARGSGRADAAVDRERHAGDVAAGGAGQEDQGRRELLRVALARDEHAGLLRPLEVAVGVLGRHLALEEPGSQRVDANPL